jgi:hypothetical protein
MMTPSTAATARSGSPDLDPRLYNLTRNPTADDFEIGTVEIPKEKVVALPDRLP